MAMSSSSSTSTSKGQRRRRRWWNRLLSDKWLTLVASFFVMSCAGALYSFGIYSQRLKTALGYNQQTVNTISFFKDLGANIGILAGILYDVSGSWLVLLLAAIFNVFGYMMAWASITSHLPHPPRVWHLCLYLWVGASSGAFASTAVIVSCVKNFPRSRGIVIGLLKGFVGLSGAMLTQIYRTLYSGSDPASFLLVVAWFPTFVFLLFMFVIRPLEPTARTTASPSSSSSGGGGDDDDADEKRVEMRNFYVFLAMAILLAIFLMIVIVVQHLVEVSAAANQAFMAVMILILALPVVIVVDSVRRTGSHSSGPAPEVPASDDQHPSDHEQLNSSPKNKVLEEDHTANQQHHEADDEESARRREVIDLPAAASTPRRRVSCSSSARQCLRKLVDEIKQTPPRGEDHTVPQALASLDLWIVFFATTAGLGSGLMVVDNLGQMGSSLGYSQSNIATFASLVSIWNFFGRVGFGFVSEIFLQKHGTPRPIFLALVLGILAIGHLYLAFAWPGAFYVGSILVGMSFGAQMPVMFAIISEIFGLKYFGTLYNVGILASPLGTYLLSVKTAGHLYDLQAQKQPQNGTSSSSSHDLLCYGSQCFRDSLLIMAAVCVFGCLISVWLAFRTRHYYKSVRSAMKQNL